MSSNLSLVHLVRAGASADGAPPLLLLLHGVGSNEHDLFGLAPYFDSRCVIVSARAPNTRAPGSYAWFDVTFTPTGPQINPEQAEASRQTLIRFIGEAAAAYGANPANVFLIGFSQGAIMSASVTLTEPSLVAGAVLMSGRILPEITPRIAPAAQLEGKPILVVHGTADNVLPIAHGRASKALLETLPVALEYHEYPMAHNVSAESLADITAWLQRQLQ